MFKTAAVHIEQHIPKKAKDHARVIDQALKENDFFVDHAVTKKNDYESLADDLLGKSNEEDVVAPFHHEFKRK